MDVENASHEWDGSARKKGKSTPAPLVKEWQILKTAWCSRYFHLRNDGGAEVLKEVGAPELREMMPLRRSILAGRSPCIILVTAIFQPWDQIHLRVRKTLSKKSCKTWSII
jgi:hypothetical protein